MYADRVETGTKRSIKQRLYGNAADDSSQRRQLAGKRQRQDDEKWEHDLFDDDEIQVANRRVGAKDLRFKLQRKSVQQATQFGKGPLSVSGGVRDLREKLSGTMHSLPVETNPLKSKSVLEGSKPAGKTTVADASATGTKRVVSSVSRKKTQQKGESMDGFLQSLGLEKYSITFQAEEVDMAALVHMTDEDLKALGIPMGPRKKILLALELKA